VPKFSITSISPQAGQPTWPMSVPSSQKAGQRPRPLGILMLASISPYLTGFRSLVISRAEV
jgi:hypothetical protein